jgi:membrane protein CcdC involved in cytochrome C biogenesis
VAPCRTRVWSASASCCWLTPLFVGAGALFFPRTFYSTSDNVSLSALVLSALLSVALLAYTAMATGSRPTAGSVAHSAPSQRSP